MTAAYVNTTRDMEQLLKEHERLEGSANLGKAIEDIDILISQLKTTREAIVRGEWLDY